MRGEDDEAPVSGAILLGQVAPKLTMLEVDCRRCDRRGRLSIARLMAEHGPAMPMPELRQVVAADCPRLVAQAWHDVCGVRFPGLVELAP